MAAIPPLNQICQQHGSIYETYFQQVSSSGTGTVGASEAARFLKRSGLPEGSLHNIWELADFGSKGYLDKQGFYIALKLISLAQNGKDISLKNLALPCSPPNMGDSPRVVTQPVKQTIPQSDTTSWGIKAKEKLQYDGIFDSLKPKEGRLLSGDQVRPVLLNSKLPVDVLKQIWDISDIDEDGHLDRDEFAVVMHLVYRALDGEKVPTILPTHLIPPSKRKTGPTHTSMPSSVGYTPKSSTANSFTPSITAEKSWVVTPADKAKYDKMFAQADTDHDGLVSGVEIKDILIASGLAQNVLAHIWNLCDTNSSGQLNSEQFALAMYLLSFKRSGKELPQTLPTEMMPPSARTSVVTSDLSSITIQSTSNDFSAIKELDKITTDIETLGREKASLQQEISQTEEAIRKRKTEIEDLQVELEKANKGLVILTKQKTEAKDRLDGFDEERTKYKTMLKDINSKCQDEQQMLNLLKSQLASQQTSVKDEEEELQKGRRELEELRKEESKIEEDIETNKQELASLKNKVAVTKSEILKGQNKVKELNDENNSLKEEITQYTAMANSSTTVNSTASLNEFSSLNDTFETRFKDVDQISARATAGSSPVSSISGFSVGSSGKIDEDNEESDPFKSKTDPFGTSEIPDPFSSDDPFKSDPFKTVSFTEDPFSGDPFQDNDPFKSDPFKPSSSVSIPSEATKSPEASGTDPFRSLDPFGSGAFAAPSSTTAAFPAAKSKSSESVASDPFASNDMFAATLSDETDSLALPEKIPKTPTTDPFTSDPFASSDPFGTTNSGDPFKSESKGSESDPFSSSTKTADPFASATTSSDPFASSSAAADPFSASSSTSSDPFASSTTNETVAGKDDPWFAFGNNASAGKQEKGKKDRPKSEDSQLEWAKRESEREEMERQKRLKELAQQEEMEIAIALKQSVESSSDA